VSGRTDPSFDPTGYGLDIYFPGDVSEGRVRRFDRFLHLYKLHGSINWVVNSEPASIPNSRRNDRSSLCSAVTASRQRAAAPLRPEGHPGALQPREFPLGRAWFCEIGPRATWHV